MYELGQNAMNNEKFSTPAAETEKRSTPAFDTGKLSTPAFRGAEFSNPESKETGIFEEIENLLKIEEETPEVAPEMEIQAELIREEFLNISEVQYENWKGLTVEERVVAMNVLEQYVAQVEMRDPVAVTSEKLEYPVMGYYNHEENVIVVSESSVGDDSYEAYVKTMETFFHEGSHAYQHYNLEVRQVEQNDEMVNAWRINYQEENYENDSYAMVKTHGLMWYANQVVEESACVFTETVINKLEL